MVIGVGLGFLVLFLFVPLAAVFSEALRHGLASYFASFKDADTISAIKLTLLTAAIAVPLNLVFGVAASWAIARFEFHGDHLAIGERKVGFVFSITRSFGT